MLKDLLVSEVRVKILKIMLPQPEQPYHVRALVRAVGTEINAVRRELLRLSKAGLLNKRPSGNRIYYSVNTSNVYYPELLSLVSKEDGIGAEIINNRKKLGKVKFAVLSRAFLRGRESSMLDVDLFMVGAINEEELKLIVQAEQEKSNKEINYTILGEDEFMFRKRRSDQFVMRFLSQTRTVLIGDEEQFCAVIS